MAVCLVGCEAAHPPLVWRDSNLIRAFFYFYVVVDCQMNKHLEILWTGLHFLDYLR